MPRALLINPWIEDFAAFDFWARPLGLLRLAASLRQAGWEVSLIDCLDVHYPGREQKLPRRRRNGSGKFDQEIVPKPAALDWVKHRRFKRYGMPEKIFRDLLASMDPPQVILVGSTMTYWYTGVAAAISEIKNARPDAPVVLGGIYATLLPDHAAANTGADHIAAGDFRTSLPPLFSELGLPPELPRDWPFPAWDLYGKISGAAVITGQGCPFDCPYCSVHAMYPKLVRREPGEVIEELTKLRQDFEVRDVAFFDDALRAKGDAHLTAILEGVIQKGLDMRFHAINALHLKNFTKELADLLRRSGFSTLRFGLETADPDRAKELGDKASLDDLYTAAGHLKNAGYRARDIGVYLLAGLPGQSPAEIESGILEVLKAGARPYISEYSPAPQSRMWDDAAAASRFDLSEPLYHNNTLLPCAHPELDEDELWRLKEIARDPFRTARD